MRRAYERRMRPFAEVNQKLGPANIKRMVMRSRGQVRVSMMMLGLMARLPGKDRIVVAGAPKQSAWMHNPPKPVKSISPVPMLSMTTLVLRLSASN